MPHSSPEALSAAFGAALNARDVPAALELWMDDAAIVQADGQMLRGRAVIGEALRAVVDSGVRMDIDVARVFTTTEVAVAVGTLTISGANADGTPFSQESQSVVISSKGADGRWRLAIDAPWGLPSQ